MDSKDEDWTDSADGGGEAALSKRQQKKMVKRQRKLEWMAARREAEKKQRQIESKAKQAERAAELQEKREKMAGMSTQELEEIEKKKAMIMEERLQKERDRKQNLEQALVSGLNIVIDLDFEQHMQPGELRSLVQQTMFSYAANLKAAVPCRLSLTSIKGAVFEQFKRLSGYENWRVHKHSQSYIDVFADRKADLVYLTADSANIANELQSDKIYIIGGLVDRNRHKCLTLQKANQQGIATARLPIAEHVKMTSSKVLTVNHVMDILLGYLETKDWSKALKEVVPQRKRAATEECSIEKGDDPPMEGPSDKRQCSLPGSSSEAQKISVEGVEGNIEQQDQGKRQDSSSSETQLAGKILQKGDGTRRVPEAKEDHVLVS